MTPRVFISSAMEGYGDCRVAAREAIRACGAEAVMAEDFPRIGSPRNGCLDGVASADVCLVILGPRGGWTTPSGHLAVEEEYEEAKRRHKIIIVFVQRGARDKDAEQLLQKLTNYVSGHLRVEFQSCTDLGTAIEQHLPPLLRPLELPMNSNQNLAAWLSGAPQVQYETTARIVFEPERQEEVIDRVDIGTPAFFDRLHAIAHDPQVKFLDFRSPKSDSLRGDDAVIEQMRAHNIERRIEVTPAGVIALDAVVTPRSNDWNDGGMTHMFFLVRSDVATALQAAFNFTGALYAAIDPYERHQRFRYGVVFAGLGHRTLVERAERRSAYSMARDLREPLTIEQARVINRAALLAPGPEVARILTLLERQLP